MKRKIIMDMFLNIVSSSFPLAVLQLIVYPIVAKLLGGENYGLMITIYSLWVMISNSFGNALNNVRLLYNNQYESSNLQGDFNIILRRWNIFNASIIGIMLIFYHNTNVINIILGIIASCLMLLKAYLVVGFRIKLNYKAIVIDNILQGLGYIAGLLFVFLTKKWEFIFLAGNLLSCIYCIKKTTLLNEKKIKTSYYPPVIRDCHNLVFANIISNLMNYADKIVLYPLMGGYSVSIYYTATILGKIISMLTGPINNVILSYISKYDKKSNIPLKKILYIGVFIIIVSYIGTVIISRPVIKILFPEWYNEVMIYLPVTTITVSLTTLISILQPFVIKFCDRKWQVIINGIGAIVYFISALFLWSIFGLMGFCIGTIIGVFVKLIIMLIVYHRSQKLYI